MNTLLQATFPRIVRSLEVTNRNILQSMRASPFDIIQGPMVAPFEGRFQFGEEDKVCWGKVGAVGRLWNCYDAIFCQGLGNHEAGVRLRLVVVELPIGGNFWSHSVDPSLQSF
ncbi:hypothetical protein TNCV_3992011 [Trichonephila clavipes]|uniref:Uncharacterized protein n=1 Tax=Trichonephila clavipes TaxID=2585209 RepID=A0A8X6VJK9_TRICX|nr:hypothetical protein TNCV_3992011 [Trichonephila clavipes]